MASHLLPVARLLGSKLKTPTKISSVPTLFSVFGSTIGNFLEQKRGFRVRVEEGNMGVELDERDEMVLVPLDEWFGKFKATVLDDPEHGSGIDVVMRNLMRGTAEKHTRQFGALNSLLGKNLAWLQLVLIDEKRHIQGNLYSVAERVLPNCPYLAEHSRDLFREAAPYFLHDTERWVFSRSLVHKGYNGSIDEAVEFPSHDPLGGLNEIPVDMPCDIRCTEVFMFIASEFDVHGGLSSREEVQKLLHELNTAEGLRKIHGFYVLCRSVKVSPEKLAVLKDMHLTG